MPSGRLIMPPSPSSAASPASVERLVTVSHQLIARAGDMIQRRLPERRYTFGIA